MNASISSTHNSPPKDELDRSYSGYDYIRQIERHSIRQFMKENRRFLMGRVLDFGAGAQPYRDLVSGTYVPHEIHDPPLEAYEMSGVLTRPTDREAYDAIMCNQVLQYVPNVLGLIRLFRDLLCPKGYLVMTYATNWDEVEVEDVHRYTRSAVNEMMTGVPGGFRILVHERRAEICIPPMRFPLGYGIVAQKL